MSTFIILIQHRYRSQAIAIIENKDIKGIQTGKEEVKLSLFADDIILQIEYSKNATRKLWEIINIVSKFSGYNINTQKFLILLFTNNKKSEREIKWTISFTTVPKRINYFGINLPKEEKRSAFWKLQDAEERNERWNTWRYMVLLDWKNQYCQNDYTTQGNLQVQWNSHQITRCIFHKTRTKKF